MENKYEDELSRAAVAYVVEPLPDTLEMERWANADALTRHTMCFIAGAAYARKHTSQLGDAYAQLLDDDQLLKLLPFINGAHEWMSGAKTIRDQYEADRQQTHAELATLRAQVEAMRKAGDAMHEALHYLKCSACSGEGGRLHQTHHAPTHEHGGGLEEHWEPCELCAMRERSMQAWDAAKAAQTSPAVSMKKGLTVDEVMGVVDQWAENGRTDPNYGIDYPGSFAHLRAALENLNTTTP